MTRDAVNRICRALPGAEWSDPWGGGHDAWKVGGKVFAAIGTADTGVSVKTPDIETASLLIEMGRAVKAPYFHRAWVHVPWRQTDDDELRARIEISYDIVRAGLTKKLQAQLGPRDTATP